MDEPTMITCPSCGGRGEWETECCNGAGGCDCGGRVVPMGTCLVCQGSGEIPEDSTREQRRANINSIAGRCFIGRGPTTGFWANKPCGAQPSPEPKPAPTEERLKLANEIVQLCDRFEFGTEAEIAAKIADHDAALVLELQRAYLVVTDELREARRVNTELRNVIASGRLLPYDNVPEHGAPFDEKLT